MRVGELPLPLRIAIVVLALAVFVCLALPMANGDTAMSIGLMCYFVLAILLSVFLLREPQQTLLPALAMGVRPPLPRSVLATARPPDPVSLGSLLI